MTHLHLSYVKMDVYVLAHIIEFLPFERQVKMRQVNHALNDHIYQIYGNLNLPPTRLCKKACFYGYMKIMEYLFNAGIGISFVYLLKCACRGGHREIVNLVLSKGENDYNKGLYGACRGGHHELVQLMLSKGANCGWGLCGACKGGHLDLVQLMLSKGTTHYDWGLWGACQGGQREMVDLMISKGATDYNSGLTDACRSGHQEIVELMISKGAYWCGFCHETPNDHLGKRSSPPLR
jgi:hypothetical protein